MEPFKCGTFMWNLGELEPLCGNFVEPGTLSMEPLCGTSDAQNFFSANLYVERYTELVQKSFRPLPQAFQTVAEKKKTLSSLGRSRPIALRIARGLGLPRG